MEPTRHNPMAWALVAGTVAVMVGTRLSPMWLIAVGAAVGAAGLV